ncbi:MAG: DUF539 domain-containing protein [Myxococcota bacterium]|nr:hypothetical protein [Myxococcales bacterium]
MTVVVATAAVFGIVVLAMSLGAMVGGRHLKGSCGGRPDGACPCSEAEKRACAERARDAA